MFLGPVSLSGHSKCLGTIDFCVCGEFVWWVWGVWEASVTCTMLTGNKKYFIFKFKALDFSFQEICITLFLYVALFLNL